MAKLNLNKAELKKRKNLEVTKLAKPIYKLINAIPIHRIETKKLKEILIKDGKDYQGLAIELLGGKVESKNRLKFQKVVDYGNRPDNPNLTQFPVNDGGLILYKYPIDDIEHFDLTGELFAFPEFEFEKEKDGFKYSFFTKLQLDPIFKSRRQFIEIRGTILDFGEGIPMTNTNESTTFTISGPYFTFMLIAQGKKINYLPAGVLGKMTGDVVEEPLPAFTVGIPCPPIWDQQ